MHSQAVSQNISCSQTAHISQFLRGIIFRCKTWLGKLERRHLRCGVFKSVQS